VLPIQATYIPVDPKNLNAGLVVYNFANTGEAPYTSTSLGNDSHVDGDGDDRNNDNDHCKDDDDDGDDNVGHYDGLDINLDDNTCDDDDDGGGGVVLLISCDSSYYGTDIRLGLGKTTEVCPLICTGHSLRSRQLCINLPFTVLREPNLRYNMDVLRRGRQHESSGSSRCRVCLYN
jgi:hypothetical protein